MVAVLVFWIKSYRAPLLLPVELGILLRANPKIAALLWTTIAALLWTTIGSLLSSLTLYLLNGMLLLMTKQVIAMHGASLSEIDGEFPPPELSGFHSDSQCGTDYVSK